MLSRILRPQKPLVIDPVAMLEISKRIFGNRAQQESVQAGTSTMEEPHAGKEEMAVRVG